MANGLSVWISPECEVHVFFATAGDPGWGMPFPCLPPHTDREPMLACLDRGGNVHGDLRDAFYVLTNDGYVPSHYVLWSGESGSQCDDDRARLTPVAYIDIGELPDFDKREDEEYAASLALLCGWIRMAVETWNDYDLDTECVPGTLSEDVIKKLLEIGCSSDRMDLQALLP